MARVELIMPKMGESIMEATILGWRKKPGDRVELDEAVLDIATDKVDSEVPSPVAGVLVEILFKENDVVPINTPIAVIETESEGAQPAASPAVADPAPSAQPPFVPQSEPAQAAGPLSANSAGRFYSPLVRAMAREEGIGQA